MASLAQVVAAHDRRQAKLAERTAKAAGKLWSRIEHGYIGPSWTQQLGQLFVTVSSAQGIAAASAGVYVDDALEAQGVTGDPAGTVRVGAFAGVASDGRPLTSLLYQPAITALTAIGAGATPVRALTLGRTHLDMIVRTQVADASRVANGVALTVRRHATGYVRMVSGGACSRCIVLAGRHYAWNQGFLRHPQCQCRNVPVAENVPGDVSTDPRKAFDAMSAAEQDKTFTKAGAEAIRNGADISQVVNARRGMRTASVFGRDVQITTEGTTTRGLAGRRLGARESGRQLAGNRYRTARAPRLMPEQILREANGNRDEAIRLLKRFGYIT